MGFRIILREIGLGNGRFQPSTGLLLPLKSLSLRQVFSDPSGGVFNCSPIPFVSLETPSAPKLRLIPGELVRLISLRGRRVIVRNSSRISPLTLIPKTRSSPSELVPFTEPSSTLSRRPTNADPVLDIDDTLPARRLVGSSFAGIGLARFLLVVASSPNKERCGGRKNEYGARSGRGAQTGDGDGGDLKVCGAETTSNSDDERELAVELEESDGAGEAMLCSVSERRAGLSIAEACTSAQISGV